MSAGGFSPATVRVILERDDGRCARCGVSVQLDARGVAWSVHHRRPRGMGGSRDPLVSSPVNGVVLCGSGVTGCHGHVESNRDQGRLHGWLVPKWRDPTEVPVEHWAHGWSWITEGGYRALSEPELWLLAGRWLDDEMTSRGLSHEDEEVVRLSRAAADLFGVKARRVTRL